MKLINCIVATLFAFTLSASPVIKESSVQVSMTPAGVYNISYTLENEPALVTFDIMTNGVSIGASTFASATGDYGKKVLAGQRSIKWDAFHSWGPRQVQNLSVKVRAWAVNNPPPYMVLSFDGTTLPMYYESTNAIPGWGVASNRYYKSEKMVMRKIPARLATFRMGAGKGEANGGNTLEVPHLVTLTKDFYICVYEVTQAQFMKVHNQYTSSKYTSADEFPYFPAGGRPYVYLRGARPDYDWPTKPELKATSDIGWFRTKTLCDTLDLPTEAQWEFACRAGTSTDLYTGYRIAPSTSTSDLVGEVAWYAGNAAPSAAGDSEGWVHEVGLKLPNAFGLYDMLGNAQEAVLDWDYGSKPSSDGTPVVDPVGPSAPPSESWAVRTYRGGGYTSGATGCLCSSHLRNSQTESWGIVYGWRLACSAEVK